MSERAQMEGRGRGRGRSRFPTKQGAWPGARSQDLDIMTWAEGGHTATWATQVPPIFILIIFYPYKYNLVKFRHFLLFDNASHATQHIK